MEKPKIRIDSDGKKTEIYVDGKNIPRATMIDFHFLHDAEMEIVRCTLEQIAVDENSRPIVENNEIKVKLTRIY